MQSFQKLYTKLICKKLCNYCFKQYLLKNCSINRLIFFLIYFVILCLILLQGCVAKTNFNPLETANIKRRPKVRL